MKDKNNLLTSMIVALLAGIVYYLAGADSIEKLAPQFGLIESNTQNKNDITVVFSKADKNCEDKSFELKTDKPVKFKVQHVTKNLDKFEFDVTAEDRELASSSNEPDMKFGDAMEMLKNKETGETILSSLEEVGKEKPGNDFEWKTENAVEIERPAIAWTESENSHSLKSRVKTKMPKVYSKAMAAVFIGEGDIMTGKVKLHKKTNAGKDKIEKKETHPTPDKKSTKPVLIDGNINFIPDAKELNCTIPSGQSNSNMNVNVQTCNGVSFIYVTTDDDGNCTCKVKCNK